LLLLANFKKHSKITRVDKEWNRDLLNWELSKGKPVIWTANKKFYYLDIWTVEPILECSDTVSRI